MAESVPPQSLVRILSSPIMKREYPDSPLIGVGAVVIDDGRVLLVKRGHPPLLGEWSIPGGVLELGETLREAAVREAREETCLTVEPVELLGVYDRVIRDDLGRTLYHYVLVDFLCRRTGGEARAADDADEVRWFTATEAAKLSLAEDTAEVVRLGFLKADR
jgi:ADP-ribose pyrophosphatase YjhB (NUDIX family)